ncbi:MAG: LPS assembly lipoprotein LptE [Flavobacteriaceae bacterium]|nr:LPS assembly lipoprotein LptE [Flavobacteriaceae bacterium]
MKNKILCIAFGVVTLTLSGCYSFTGSSLDPSIKTIEIKSFPNYSAYQSPNLSVDFTTALQNRFNQRTKLKETNIEPDIVLDGEITNFNTSPVNIQSGSDEATQNRLTITVAVRYENKIQPEKSFERTFSDYEDYSSTELLIDVQDDLAQKINQRIIDQIFIAIVADW